MGPLDPAALPHHEPPAAAPSPWDERLAEATRRALGWLPLSLAIGLAPGAALVALQGAPHLLLETNRLGSAAALPRLLGPLLLVALAMVVLARGLVVRGADLHGAMRRVNGWLAPALVLPLFPWLATTANETARPFVTLLAAVAIAAAAGAVAYRLPVPSATPRRWPALLVVIALAAGYAATLSIFAIRQHHAFGTSVFDLAIYDNLFFHSSHGRPLATNFVKGGTHITGHFDPLLVLLSPLYLLYPRAELLLVLQSVWLALGAIPLFLLAARRLESPWAGVAIAAAYLLHPGLHGANMYDFHSLTLVIPLLIAAVWLIDTARLKTFAVLLPVLLLVREDVSLILCFVGAWAILSGRAPRTGALTIAVSLVYFVLVKALVMRTGLLNEGNSGSHSYAYYYRDLIPNPQEGSAGLFLSLLVNPVYVLTHMFSEAKVLYLGRMFLPVLLLPLLVPRARLMLIFGLASVLLASKPAVYSLYFQYVATILPFALALAPAGIVVVARGGLPALAGLEPRRLVAALAGAVLACTAVISTEYGVLLPNDAFRAGFQRFNRDPSAAVQERYAWLREQLDALPADASVSATKRLVPHVSNREHVHEFPKGGGHEYLLIDDRSLGKHRSVLDRYLKAGAYEPVARGHGMALYRRVAGVPLP